MYQILCFILILIILYFVFNKKEPFTNTSVQKNIHNEMEDLNNNLNDFYQEQKNMTENIIMQQDDNNQESFKKNMNYQSVGLNNLLNVDNVAYDKFKNMYSHQTECPCYNGKVIGFDNCENNMDVFKISNEALKQHDNKDCVTCNFLNETNATLTPQQMEQDKKEVEKNKLVNSNIENYSDYRDVSNQDSNIGVNAVDRINECRTGNGTCDLSKFGTTIWQAYDNLMSDGYQKYKNSTNPQLLTGINDETFENNYKKL